jgi:SAM-dependent methyltransferase
LEQDGEWLISVQEPGRRYPIVRGIPLLIDDDQSVFQVNEIKAAAEAVRPLPQRTVRGAILRALPSLSRNYSGEANLRLLVELIQSRERPKVLIVGGGSVGVGVEALLRDPEIEVLESDIFVGDRTNLCCDAHQLPLADESIDGVLIQAVLGQTLDPWRCVGEIKRVLKRDGLVYAETPYVQQNAGGAYDFNRFTPLGHRRLFREFEEIRSGIQGGPGMVLAWSWRHLLLSTTRNRTLRASLHAIASLTAFWLPWLDRWLLGRPGAVDAASGVYFLGRRSTTVLSDRELVRSYNGCF